MATQVGGDALVFIGGEKEPPSYRFWEEKWDRHLDWALLRPLRRLLKRFGRAAWFVFMDDVTHINREARPS
jgi:hypothetical protein